MKIFRVVGKRLLLVVAISLFYYSGYKRGKTDGLIEGYGDAVARIDEVMKELNAKKCHL